MNKFIGVGRLCQEPEVKYTPAGKAVANFNIAIDSGFGDKKKTDFVPIVCWEKLAEVVGNNLTKGRRILVEGRLQIRTYDADDGQKRRVAEIVAQNIEFLDSKQGGSSAQAPANDPAAGLGHEVFPEDSEVPF
jgi:single-strand DNA-binding protein